ncbi:MAG: thioredoxin family protein [Gallionella sp.]
MKQIKKSLLIFLALLFPLFAHAVGEPFTRQKLDALNKAGSPVLVAVHANWCSVCRAQDYVLKSLLQQPKFQGIKTLRVDFDQQKSEVNALDAEYQSTLIVFKGGKEVDRISFERDSDRIAALLKKAL